MLNTRVYDVMFPDGNVQQYSANVIAQSIYDSVDEDGHRHQLLDTDMYREGNLNHVLYMFSYLKCHHNSRLVLDPTYPDIYMKQFPQRNWKQFYGNSKEILRKNAPKPVGKEFIIRPFVDADFAG